MNNEDKREKQIKFERNFDYFSIFRICHRRTII